MQVKVVLKDQAKLPAYQTAGAAGFDLSSTEDLTIGAGQTRLVPTGVHVELPVGTEMQVRSRSGLAAKHSIFVLNSPGTVDADYRGEVKVILHNAGSQDFTIQRGDRIAQGVIAPVIRALFVEVESLTTTERGAGGFGSTGV